ncbi:type VI secretion system-associated protein TagF [Uliginosibacterium sediminicola]|uniref:Type VI secretion system-associated protein TagF n=1 Tax=Uliginosibacterium sediminicola TaxID=2024550 RepID=A0ABU9Z0X9_9RHOO
MDKHEFHLLASTEPLLYFGKLPSRDDFIRSESGAVVIQPLDRWITVNLEQLALAPDWKQQFDTMSPIDFAFIGKRSNSVLAGRMSGSHDRAGRRYPFLIAGHLRSETPLKLLPVLPLVLLPAWSEMDELLQVALAAAHIETALQRIEQARLSIDTDSDGLDARFASYLHNTSLSTLQISVRGAGNPVDLRKTIIALGLLLTPLLSQSAGSATKGLALPLPGNNGAAALVAALWLSMLAPFLARSDFDLSVLRAQLAGRPQLIISFNGAHPRVIESILNPACAFDNNIDMCAADWVEDYIASEYPLNKLSSYLSLPDLSLAQALQTFNEVFLGA